MTGHGRARVEFVDPADDLASDTADLGAPAASDQDHPHGRVHGHGRWWLAPAVVALVGVGVLARLISAPSPTATPAAAAVPVFGGSVDLPNGFGAPVGLASAATGGGDVVWVLGAGGRVARVEDSAVRRVSPEAGYTVLVTAPDGSALYAATATPSPAVLRLDPVSLTPAAHVLVAAPVTALAADADQVWAAGADGVQGWTAGLQASRGSLALPADVTAVRALGVVGTELQATVTLAAGLTALLRLTPADGAARLTSAYAGPVSIVVGEPALVARLDPARFMQVVRDPAAPGHETVGGPQFTDTSIWPVTQTGTAAWLVSSQTSPTLDCHDGAGALVGRATVGDGGRGIAGPVVETPQAVYALTVDGRVARGGHASCGVPPASRTGGRPGGA